MAQALDAIADKARVYVAGGSAVSTSILEAMTQQRDRWSRIEIVADYLVEPLPVFAYPTEPFHVASLQPNGTLRSMIDGDAYRTAARPLSEWGGAMEPGGDTAIDVALVHVSEPGPDGRFSLGVSSGTPLAAMSSADLVIAQVNPRMPYTFGAAEIHQDEMDLLVEVEHELVEFPLAEPDDITSLTGALVASEIPHGAILQLGVGALPEAVCRELSGHRDLGIHSGLISDGVIDLVASGAFSGKTHPDHPGKIVTAMIGGTRQLFDFVDRNPDVVTVTTHESHGMVALGRLPNLIAVNSSIEVALDGSINSERVGTRIVSGPGGAPDYARATAAADGGRFFVALPSTAAKGTVSRIVSTLQGPATVDGTLVDTVVTEFGVAKLCDLDASSRADVLRSIAHPDFRSDLG